MTAVSVQPVHPVQQDGQADAQQKAQQADQDIAEGGIFGKEARGSGGLDGVSGVQVGRDPRHGGAQPDDQYKAGGKAAKVDQTLPVLPALCLLVLQFSCPLLDAANAVFITQHR